MKKKKLSPKFQNFNKIFLLTIDSVNSKEFNKENFPNLFKLKKNMYQFRKYFVHAAPTQQSFQSFFSMKPPMADGGYDFGLDKKTTFLNRLKKKKYHLSSFQGSVFFSNFYNYPQNFDIYNLTINPYYIASTFQKHFLAKLDEFYPDKKISNKKYVKEMKFVLDKFFLNVNKCLKSDYLICYPAFSKHFFKKRFVRIFEEYSRDKDIFILKNSKNLLFFSYFIPFGGFLKYLPNKMKEIIDFFLKKNFLLTQLQPPENDFSNKVLEFVTQKKIKFKKKIFFWSHFLDPHDSIGNTNNFCKKKKIIFKNSKKRYHISLKSIDKTIFSLINKISQIKQFNNSTFIITSDHGPNFDEKIHITKNFKNDITHVPLFIYNKKLQPKIINTTYQNSDFYLILSQFLEKKNFVNKKNFLYFENKGKGYSKFNNENIYLRIKNKNYDTVSEVLYKKNKIIFLNKKIEKFFSNKELLGYKKSILKYFNETK